jgi:serine/threonine protein kinase
VLQQGYEVDRYIVEEKLGEGGMAVVYRVRHATLGTRHALKVLSITSRDVRDRLIQEGRVQATLRHPNVVAVTDVIDVEGSPGLLMEYVRGPALDHWLYNYRPTLEEALAIFRGIVAGVGHAHSKGLIHRDLKPANVMLHVDDKGVHPKVTDFGLAKLSERNDLKRTRTGTTMGTPAYMAPEQIRDASTVDRRADLYSLGCILYELVCGRTPFGDDDIIELFSRVAAGDYTHPRELAPDVPHTVVDCIESLVEVRRELRLTDCASILEMLDGVSRDSLTNAIALVGPADQELAPPRPLPDPGITSLALHGPAADMARRFLVDVRTPAPLPDRFGAGSLAPRPVVQPVQQADPNTDVPLVGARSRSPVAERAATGVLVVGLSAVIVVLALALLLVFGFTVLGMFDNGSRVADPAPDPEPTQVAEPLQAPVPVAVEPSPAPVAEPVTAPDPAPVVAAPTPVRPVPVRPAPVRPAPTRPRPNPVPVQPVPTPTPAPAVTAPGTGTVLLVDVPYAVSLESGSRKFPAPGAVPAGSYTIFAAFPDGPGPAGLIVVPEGGTVRIRCAVENHLCVAR